VPRTAPVDS